MASDFNERQAIDNLTRQTDYRGLCAQLISAVSSLAGCDAALFETHDENGKTDIESIDVDALVLRRFPDRDVLPHPPWLPDVMLALQRHSEPTVVCSAHSTNQIVTIGEQNGIWRFLYLSREANADGIETISFLIRIFSNQLAVLDRFERDALTGLRNRQSFDYRFEDLLEHHQRNPKRAKVDSMPWLAIVDIDRFKSINDTYGHLFGDEILLLLARLLEQCFRFDDLLFRYGGEEFIIILNNTDGAGAELALDRFRRKIERYDFPTVGHVTVSIGWAAVRPGEIATTVIHKADRALYHAKALGRNRAVNYEQTFGEGGDRFSDGAVDLFD